MWSRAAKGMLVLGGVSAAVFPLIGWIGWRTAGPTGVVAATVSLFVALIPAVIALMLALATAETPHRLAGALAGNLIRPAFAVVGWVVFSQVAPELVAAGIREMILAWYLILLTVETIAAVWMISPKTSARPN